MGLIRFSGSDVYANSALDAIAAYGKSKGWTITEVDANGSVDSANTALTNLATKGVDAIATSVFPTDALATGVASAQAAGIPVANWGGGLGPGVPIAADVAIGAPMAERVVNDLGGEGALLALGYRPGLPCQRREKALEEAVAKTGIQMDAQQITIPGQVESAYKATQAWAQARPRGGRLAVWSCFDDPATGAVAALQQLGRTDVRTYGLNGTAEALALVKAGKLTATQWIDGPSQGREIARLLEKYWAAPKDFKPVEIDGDYKIIDKTNVDGFLADHPELSKSS
ncbi:ABC-type sugar transport system substrate-binding protein [Thermocatellispora tengchongensis]|uniref:ABC-type sugar transport system substrate-binding protein n=1 Tax=Thermocatellispora tengchongensis TaxID=1073253 RepID=A0A840PFV4_9ACTN|nr:sugar ABC transporter substrate-binding protein [Thermocatellispora tengchongensis]MBB5136721.1 ABC-type sugar transport system substrate-binding protein [Thermocatellispora tengchongensis]